MIKRGEGELLFNGHRTSAWDDEKLLEMHCGDGLMSLQCRLKHYENDGFYVMYILTQ